MVFAPLDYPAFPSRPGHAKTKVIPELEVGLRSKCDRACPQRTHLPISKSTPTSVRATLSHAAIRRVRSFPSASPSPFGPSHSDSRSLSAPCGMDASPMTYSDCAKVRNQDSNAKVDFIRVCRARHRSSFIIHDQQEQDTGTRTRAPLFFPHL
ncbi:hypothetical protein BOTBODRAFT_57449 [Botryobasidium botryosum FD-172 SS1]|uniref:Uncharacterized protein n=1 Tax=Botryobasidium botryosum (strain FD-172 SS1) TaxID=930990 RepID=A0A067M703_BOTB1|nr:hypothetical protein BOTBODRAFT_57449 [Botryobasidium botryosum FD-172 SS1]